MLRLIKERKAIYFHLRQTSVLTRLKNQNLIWSILSPPFFTLVITCFIFSVFCCLVPKTNFHHVLRCPSSESLVLCVCVSCVPAWCLHAGVSLFLSLASAFPLSSLFFFFLSLCSCSLSLLHVFSPRLPLSLCAGDVLFQMAEVHRQIQVQLEEMVGILSSKGS